MTQFEIAQIGNESVTYAITDAGDVGLSSTFILGCSIEIGNHGDIGIVNQLTGKRLWIGASFDQAIDLYDALQRAVNVAKELLFLG